MNDMMSILVVVVAFGAGYFLISKLIDFSRNIVAKRPEMFGERGTGEPEFLWNVCSMAKGVAMADGPLNSQELTAISDYISRNTKGDTNLNVMLTKLVNDPAKLKVTVEKHAEQCHRLKGGYGGVLAGVFDFLEGVASSDGPINEAERGSLVRIRGGLKLG
jgi:hypothetical protein